MGRSVTADAAGDGGGAGEITCVAGVCGSFVGFVRGGEDFRGGIREGKREGAREREREEVARWWWVWVRGRQRRSVDDDGGGAGPWDGE